MLQLLRDLKYGLRSLLRDRGFAATVVVTLAVSMAANTATFAIVNSVLLRPLPVPDARSILLMSNSYPKAGAADMDFSSAADYYDRLSQAAAFQEQAMFRYASQTLDLNGTAERVRGMAVTPSLFRLLRFPPALGRTFTDPEGELGAERKVILSYGLWQQLYGSSRAALGRDLRLGGRPFTVVGVMPPAFSFIDPKVRLWIPLAFRPDQKTAYHNNSWYNIGRLKPGATIQQAQAQVDAINRRNLDRFPEVKPILVNAGFHTVVRPLEDMLVHDVRRTLYLLWGGAVLVLLIGVLNIANLALARLTLRRKELATRLAIGAGRGALVRQMVVENVLLAVAGGAVGVGLGAALLRALAAFGLDRFPRAWEVGVDGRVILVSMVMAALCGTLIGLAPLADLFRLSLSGVLREGSRTGTSGRGARRVRQGLVTGQVGLAFALLVGAGLLLASFRQLLRVDPGFTMEGVLTAGVNAPPARYPGDDQVRALVKRSLTAMRDIPGVVAAGATTDIPLSTDHSDSVILAEGYAMKPGESVISPRRMSITPGYFEALGIPMVSGRAFDDGDDENAPRAVIVDERLAKRFWPDRNPIGRRMYQPNSATELLAANKDTKWLRVVGVVRSIRLDDLAGNGAPVGAYYFPYAQDPERGVTFAIKTRGDAAALSREVRARMAKIDPELALFEVLTMGERADLSLASRKASMTLATAFGGLALFLSAIGIYGVLAYLVSQRRREIGIRVALGSSRGGIVALVLREGLALVGIGLLLGAGAAVAMQKVVANEIYGVRPLDPAVLAIVTVALALVGLAACIAPARRAVQVDPVTVLSEQ